MNLYFSAKSAEWAWLSNLYPSRFDLDGLTWKSVEHYYQAQKYVGTPAYKMIREAKDGFAALKAGGNRSLPQRSDWNEVKRSVMEKALEAKFQQSKILRAKLLDTHDAVLCHQSSSDLFWGCNIAGEGENHLGQLIMQIRTEMRTEPRSNC